MKRKIPLNTFKRNEFMTKIWWDPNCRIIDTRTGKVLKEYGVTITPT